MYIWENIVNYFSQTTTCTCKRNDIDYCQSIEKIMKMTKKEFNKEIS